MSDEICFVFTSLSCLDNCRNCRVCKMKKREKKELAPSCTVLEHVPYSDELPEQQSHSDSDSENERFPDPASDSESEHDSENERLPDPDSDPLPIERWA
mmetsp:Transcript_13241/g.28739  ORF Transcript_13241/g.28739 Transcript_13241/m.28739 type:complete len:99 (-) Transcript_13241:142-438(-)